MEETTSWEHCLIEFVEYQFNNNNNNNDNNRFVYAQIPCAYVQMRNAYKNT